MKIKVLSNASDLNHPGLLKLKQSLEHFGYDYAFLNEGKMSQHTGLMIPYKWCKEKSDGYTHILYTDGFDTVALAPMSEVIEKLKYCDTDSWMYSVERACYPISEWSEKYPKPQPITPWRYINGGQFFVPIQLYIDIIDRNPRGNENDQEWAHANFLFRNEPITLETKCEIFQSIAFEDTNDFALTRDRRLLNRKTGTLPCFAHGNGHTNMEWIYSLLP